jgi:tetratricopeptide (TPR) repeat protein
LQAALADCHEALRRRPDDPNFLDSRGLAYLKSGRFDDAIVDYNAALLKDAKLAGALYGRGIAKTRKGDRIGGAADIDAATAINPGIAEEFAHYGLR